jgi:hypothetical protein
VKLRDVVGRAAVALRLKPADDGRIRIAYTPDDDGNADPGEVVWTWVPYEDDPSQGKDRPVVVIGSTASGGLAVVPLSSQGHDSRGDAAEWVEVGNGGWDSRGRASYAHVDRVLRVRARDIRREGATLDRRRFDAVVGGVRRRHPGIG